MICICWIDIQSFLIHLDIFLKMGPDPGVWSDSDPVSKFCRWKEEKKKIKEEKKKKGENCIKNGVNHLWTFLFLGHASSMEHSVVVILYVREVVTHFI